MRDAAYDDFFECATGYAPYDYQRELATGLPSVLAVPTGSGKTHALVVSWLYERRVLDRSPRRLVYALPMRTLVEQTAEVARAVRDRLGLTAADLPVHILMGGEAPTDWRHRPEHDQILVGTIDMLLSRALARGYGESRFQWPVSFGLLNADCRWVLDEVQLMGPARATSAQLDGLRAKLGVARPCETIWASATVDRAALETVDRPALGHVLGLSEADRSGPLSLRLEATKRVVRADVSAGGPAERASAVADAVLEAHRPSSRSIVVLNTVERAQTVAGVLWRRAQKGDGPRVVLLHSRFRPGDRLARMAEALAPVDAGPGVVVVATQVIEAGVDVSSRLLATETAPFSSIVQRLGRCNREGEYDEATALWLDTGSGRGADAKLALPYPAEDLEAAHEALERLVGASASPARLAALTVPETREPAVTLRRRDVLDLFDTGPDLSGLDVDISPFIREADERTVSVFFRDVATDAARGVAVADQPGPGREELVEAPVGDVRGRRAWTWDHVDGRWVTPPAPLRPGETALLDSAEGGYDERLGWSRTVPPPVAIVVPVVVRPEEAIGDDPGTVERQWMSLEDHLGKAHTHATALADACSPLDLPDGALGVVAAAAALHDIGKSHAVFQETLARLGPPHDGLWAKSAKHGGRHRRRHFRHELASALALRAVDGGLPLEPSLAPLVIYLVAAHHGRVRLSIRPAPEEERPPNCPEDGRFALGVADFDVLPALETPLGSLPSVTLDLACMELGEGSWTEQACRLRDDESVGPFRLGYLEALVRIADWRASA
ncbi:MAG: CRISPR-associated endonuclease Cas3'' [Actinobacteria bacterium]|nr:CRISPR-associated endonuclease Cas3'' [Actinomycetota bacterium]